MKYLVLIISFYFIGCDNGHKTDILKCRLGFMRAAIIYDVVQKYPSDIIINDSIRQCETVFDK